MDEKAMIVDGRRSGRSSTDRRTIRRCFVVTAGAALALAVTSCSIDIEGPPAGRQPEVSIECPQGFVDITLKNVSDKPARYVVSVNITYLGTATTEQFSSNTVAAGQTATIHESRVETDGTCRVGEVEVFDAE